ncbi:MAG TPA: ABC-F family ATP-binding cassette domain-containing protein, partial [Acidimicrobiales bacterium]|nr:ABC-F family ATP-binding cassette domain-containing protein [Acidimicrobiales bacterium]
MLTVSDLELAVAGRQLLQPATFQVAPGDRIGLVGRNGAGKTTLAKVLAGEALPAGGLMRCSGAVAYLPQDPRTGDLEVRAIDRILGARDLDKVIHQLEATRHAMGDDDPGRQQTAMTKYARLEERFHTLGGWTAEAEAASIASSLGLPQRVLDQRIGTLSGGQRRRVELSRVLFSEAPTLVLDEPTNHLDADSIVWLKGFLKAHDGGLIVISHDAGLLEAVVNKVFHLDATRCELDVYRLGWKAYLEQLATDERRRRRERQNAERKVVALRSQADRMRAKATKARMAHNLDRRAARLESGLEQVRHADKVAKLRFPRPSPCGRTPLTAEGLMKSYGSLEVFCDVDLAVDRGSRVVVLGLNGAGKTTLLRLLAGIETPDVGQVIPGHGLKLGYYAQEHETLVPEKSVWENVRHAAPPEVTDAELRRMLGSFLFG